jgi:large subunit ribosomal protein L30
MAKVRITQVRSIIKTPQDQKDTIRALGFKKLGQTVEHDASPQILGMAKKVAHLVKIENI